MNAATIYLSIVSAGYAAGQDIPATAADAHVLWGPGAGAAWCAYWKILIALSLVNFSGDFYSVF